MEPRIWPLPRSSSASVSPPDTSFSTSLVQMDSTSSALDGRQPT